MAEKHAVSDPVFLVDTAEDLIGAVRRDGDGYRVQRHGFRNPVERVCIKV